MSAFVIISFLLTIYVPNIVHSTGGCPSSKAWYLCSSVSSSAAAHGITRILPFSSTAISGAAAIISSTILEPNSSLFSGIVPLVAFLMSHGQIGVDGFLSKWVWNHGADDGGLNSLLFHGRSGFALDTGDWIHMEWSGFALR